jgi:ABC-type sugar transport system permease subunit
MSVKRKKSMLKKEIIDFGKGFIFVAPNFIGYLCFTIIPVFISFMLCFTKWNINESLSNVKFVGFMYFKQLFSDENFFKSIENNFTVMLIFVPLSTIIVNEIRINEHEKKELHLEVLQNQINPHFLLNTLNAIKWNASLLHTI